MAKKIALLCISIFLFTGLSLATAQLQVVQVQVAQAQGVKIDPGLYPTGAPTLTGKKPAENDDYNGQFINTVTGRIVTVVLGLAGTVAIFFIMNDAWYLIASAGNEEKITEHKKGLMWAVVGLLLIIFSYSIIRFIISIPFQAGEKPPPLGGSEASPAGDYNTPPAAG